MTSESSRASISRAPWSACPGCWNMFTVAKPVGGQTNASTPQDRRARARHCRRWLRLTSNGASDAPTPSLRPRSPPSSTPPEVCPETMEFDIRRTHGTTTTHAPHSSPKIACLPSRAFLAPAPSAAHLVIAWKEIRCTRCHPKK